MPINLLYFLMLATGPDFAVSCPRGGNHVGNPLKKTPLVLRDKEVVRLQFQPTPKGMN